MEIAQVDLEVADYLVAMQEDIEGVSLEKFNYQRALKLLRHEFISKESPSFR